MAVVAVVIGFPSSFRDYMGYMTDHQESVVEMALAHWSVTRPSAPIAAATCSGSDRGWSFHHDRYHIAFLELMRLR